MASIPRQVAEDSGVSQELCKALYASCSTQPSDTLFSQDDLLAMNVIPNGDLGLLVKCLNVLTGEGLFKLMNKDGKTLWKLVKKEDAAKYRNLGVEEAVVYSYIESAGREGVWTRTIRNRSNIHLTVFNRCLKSLETKNLIKPIQSAKFPKRKIYILASLQPSEDVTGGPFFTDGVLDEEFVHQLCLLIEKYVHGRSWFQTTSRAKPSRQGGEPDSVKEGMSHRKGQLHGIKTLDSKDGPPGAKKRGLLPMPPGYSGYPTISEITKAVNDSGLSSVIMREVEVGQLLDLLCWDGNITRVMNGMGYKSLRKANRSGDDIAGNGLTEAPCGRCPVFELCEESGPVNARSCDYFKDWLFA